MHVNHNEGMVRVYVCVYVYVCVCGRNTQARRACASELHVDALGSVVHVRIPGEQATAFAGAKPQA